MASPTVVANPIQAATGGERRSQRPSWVQTAAPVVAEKASAARSWIAADPWQSTATLASFISFAFLLISLISPWLMFSTGYYVAPILGKLERYGQATLLDVRTCVNVDSSTAATIYLPDKECTTWLDTTGPAALSWMRKAGGAAFAFVIFAIAPGFVAFWLTYLRRIGALKTLPAFAQRFRDYIWTVGFHALTAFFMMIAWAVWAGQVNSNKSVDTFAALRIYDVFANTTIGPAPDFTPTINYVPIPFVSTTGPVTSVSVWFGGGFGLAITSFILSIISAIIIYFFHTEKVHAPEHPAAAAAAGGASAPGPSAYIGTAGGAGDSGAYGGVDAHTGARSSLPFPPADQAYRVPGYGNDDAAPQSMNDVKI